MEILTSKRFKLPTLYFISDRSKIKDIPAGIPFVYGDKKDKPYFIRLLEYEVLYKKALATKLPFNWKQILKDSGFTPIEIEWHSPLYFDYKESDKDYDGITVNNYDINSIQTNTGVFKEYINDSCAVIDIDKLKDLKRFPIWLDTIEKAVKTNIHNFILYNPLMYNKKLEGMYGGVSFESPNRNAIITDISGSMTKAIATMILLLSKTYSESFYCDLIVTGSITVVYPYELLHTLDVEAVYEEVGRGNESKYFKKIVSEYKKYNTVIVFGDNDHPGRYGGKRIADIDGKKICNWEVDTLISLHKDSNTTLAGYARWFTPKKTEHISNWVKYLNK